MARLESYIEEDVDIKVEKGTFNEVDEVIEKGSSIKSRIVVDRG
jgi:hypothetical protein